MSSDNTDPRPRGPARRKRAAAARPGAVVSILDYGPGGLNECPAAGAEDIRAAVERPGVCWVQVRGRPSHECLEMLAAAFGLHPLAVEDIANLKQRPKLELYDHGCFVVLGLPALHGAEVDIEQVSLFLGERYVISFHEGGADIFEPVRQRLLGPVAGRIRNSGSDYLLYALIDLVVDAAFPLVDDLDDRLEDLEERVLREPGGAVLDDLHDLRRMLIRLRRGLGPQREVLQALIRDDHRYIRESTKVYLRDVYDHTVRILESLESCRELVLSTQEIYMSSLGMRMNEVMKVLAVIATIFIPLSFITGLYGMNFNTEASPWNMPELDAYYGYPVLLLFLAATITGMLLYFKRRGWLELRARRP